jgi:hypothetical protein
MIAETAALTTYAKPNKAVERTGKKLALFSSRSPPTFGHKHTLRSVL